MSCEFCEKADFANYSASVVDGYASVTLAGGNFKYPKDKQFSFCPNCGEPLTEPQPLSLEELRQTIGKPFAVWVEYSEDGFMPWSKYVAIEAVMTNTVYFGGGGGLSKKDYGKTWLAYTHKPKDE